MSYCQRFYEFNTTLKKLIEKMETENNESTMLMVLRSVYKRSSDRDAIYHAAWASLFNETHRVVEKGCRHNKKAAEAVLRIMDDIEEEMLYEQDGD